MHRRITLLLATVVLLVSTAEGAGKKPFKKFLKRDEKEQIRFYGFGIFGEKGTKPITNNGSENIAGGGAYSRLGADYNINLKKFRFGWYHSLNLGYGKPKYIPYVEDLGFTGAYPIGKKHEVGVTYSFLGIYANAAAACFGSQFSVLYRYDFLQLELTKMGQGALRGCFVPKENITNFSASLSVLLPKNLILTARAMKGYDSPKHVNSYSEYRLSLGMAF